MATNKMKQNLRFQKCEERIHQKQSFKYLSKLEKQYVKAQLHNRQVSKELNQFWKDAPRTETGAVDWDSLSTSELDYFNMIYKESCRVLKKIDRLEKKGVNGDITMDKFNQLNNHSTCF